ncbi:MAG TPA: YitT family protein, partial [Draconibacterium sp.]|nr:YitT family protein [Draconibacterium sp.]
MEINFLVIFCNLHCFRCVYCCCGAQGFYDSNNFLDGGVTAASILLKAIFPVDFSVFLIVLNLPFLYIGYRKISKTFAVQSLMAVLLMAALMYLINIPAFTQDKFLKAAFGGFLIGLGIG